MCFLDNMNIIYIWEIFYVVVGDFNLIVKEECKFVLEGSDQNNGMLNFDVSSISKLLFIMQFLKFYIIYIQLIVGRVVKRLINCLVII